jgi:glucosamine--fructose-6-phosphate aminotransferase (isomerizing)
MRKEIGQQPHVLGTLLERETESILRFATRLSGALRPTYVVVAARGTSDNAARYGQYLMGAHNRLPVALATPSLYSIYERPPRLDGALVVGLSQSGQSPDIVAVLAEGRRQSVPTVAITNDVQSPLAAHADFVIPLHAGPELSVAASKTYTAELVALAILSCALDGDRERLEQLKTAPEAVDEVLRTEDFVSQAVRRYRCMESCAVLGRGYNYSTAFEIALKLKELSYIIAEAYSSADFMHGPAALLSEGFPALLVAPSGEMYDTMRDVSLELRSRGAELLVISDRPELLDQAVTPLRLPRTLREWLSPITAAVLGQLFALHLTKVKGYDPDHPRGLLKVTLTR